MPSEADRLDGHQPTGRYPRMPKAGGWRGPFPKLLRQRLLLGRREPLTYVGHVGERPARALSDTRSRVHTPPGLLPCREVEPQLPETAGSRSGELGRYT